MNKAIYYTRRLLALVPAVTLLLASCSRAEDPKGERSARAPQGDPVINVPLSINLGSPDNANPLESFDGVAPEPGLNPIIFISVKDVATSIVEFEKMVEFRQNSAQPWKYDSQEEIPLYGGSKWVYALYYPNLAGIHMGTDDVYYFRPDAQKKDSEGTPLRYTFMAKGGNPNVFSPSLDDFLIRAQSAAYDKFAGFPIVLHRSKKGTHPLVALPMSGHKTQNTPTDAYNSWANDAGGGPSWRFQTKDFDHHPHRTGTGHGTGSPDATVSFNETRKIRIGSYADMVALNDPTKPLEQNYNYNGVYKLPHNALCSSRTTVDVDALIAAHPSDTQFDVDIPLYRDYARVRVFIAKDKDNPINASAPAGPRQRIGLRGIGFVSMPSVAAPSFRDEHGGDLAKDLWSVSFNPAGGRTYNDAYAVEFASGDLKYPELKAAPQGANDDAVCEAMRANPQDYMFLLPQYIAPFYAPSSQEVDRQYATASIKGLIAIKDPSLSPIYTSGFSRYKNCYWFGEYKSFYFPRILVATYYADRDVSVYSTHKSLDDPYWTHWVPFGERFDGISTADVNPETNPAIRSLYSGHILPGRTYDVFIIVPTPEPDPSITKQVKVIVKSWVQKTITIPDFE